MQFNLLVAAAFCIPLVAAHGKIAVVQGDAGGNGTALAIKGAIVPGAGANDKTEVDTTVFKSTKASTDGLGKTTGSGQNKVEMVAQTMELSGSTLPQVSSNGGFITGTFHIVTTDGAGPIKARIDPTGTGKFSKSVKAKVSTQVPGKKGNIHTDGSVGKKRSLFGRELVKRAGNVNRDFPMKIEVPAGTTCSGTMAGLNNVCFMKIANSNPAGPFGGVIAFQIADAGNNTNTGATGKNTAGTTAECGAAKRDVADEVDDEEDVDGEE